MSVGLRCQLPVLRGHFVEPELDPAEPFARHIELCGAELTLVSEAVFYLDIDGVADLADAWRVECNNGHVVFVPDNEGNEHYSEMGFEFDDLVAALTDWQVGT